MKAVTAALIKMVMIVTLRDNDPQYFMEQR